jgi:hypothetical protein
VVVDVVRLGEEDDVVAAVDEDLGSVKKDWIKVGGAASRKRLIFPAKAQVLGPIL